MILSVKAFVWYRLIKEDKMHLQFQFTPSNETAWEPFVQTQISSISKFNPNKTAPLIHSLVGTWVLMWSYKNTHKHKLQPNTPLTLLLHTMQKSHRFTSCQARVTNDILSSNHLADAEHLAPRRDQLLILYHPLQTLRNSRDRVWSSFVIWRLCEAKIWCPQMSLLHFVPSWLGTLCRESICTVLNPALETAKYSCFFSVSAQSSVKWLTPCLYQVPQHLREDQGWI